MTDIMRRMMEIISGLAKTIIGFAAVVHVLTVIAVIMFICLSVISLLSLIVFLILQTFGFNIYVKNRKTGKREVYRFFRKVKN